MITDVTPFLDKLSLHPSLTSWASWLLMWHKVVLTRHKAVRLKPAMLSLFSNTIGQGTRGSHDQTMEAFGITYKQLITMPKMCIFWFMNQAHEP